METTQSSRHSLKTRITLATLGVFLASLWSLSFYATRSLQHDVERLVSEQQLITAGLIAEQINLELTERLQALQDISRTLGAYDLSQKQHLQTYVDQRQDLLTLFNSRVFITDPRGDTLASLPFLPEYIGVNFADRDYLITAIGKGQPSIGRPVMGRTARAPVVVMATPILDRAGQISGALAGSISLEKQTFLDQIGKHNIQQGSLTLVDRNSGLVVMSTERAQLMTDLSAGSNAFALAHFLNGKEGSARLNLPAGGDTLLAVRQIPVANWFVLVQTPIHMAFTPLESLQQRMLIVTLLFTLLAGGITWGLLRYQLAPLSETVTTLDQLSRAEHTPPPLPVVRNDEIGQLIAGFNRLLGTLHLRENALRASESHFRLLTERASDVVWQLDHRLNILYISPADEKLRGIKHADVVGRPFPEMSPEEERPLIVHAFETLAQASAKDETATFVFRQTCSNGAQIWTEILASADRQSDGSISGFHGITRNITERRQMEEKIRQLAFHDALTGLPNRRLMMDRLQQAIATCRRNQQQGALLFIDLDNFKPLNDRYGHTAGDLLLIEVAARLRSCLRETDSVARFGGDEFVVLLGAIDGHKDSAMSQVERIADKIRDTLAAPYILTVVQDDAPPRIVEHRCTASIGITLFDDTRDNPAELLRWADRAMYTAKEHGRNRLVFSSQ